MAVAECTSRLCGRCGNHYVLGESHLCVSTANELFASLLPSSVVTEFKEQSADPRAERPFRVEFEYRVKYVALCVDVNAKVAEQRIRHGNSSCIICRGEMHDHDMARREEICGAADSAHFTFISRRLRGG